MRYFLEWLSDNGFGIIASIAALTACVAFLIFMSQPSPWARSRYNECLQIILTRGTINDAETMCAAGRRRLEND